MNPPSPLHPDKRSVSQSGVTLPNEAATASPTDRFGKFIRTKLLGTGGMGEVWKAWDTELTRWVALKFLKGGKAEELERFQREARTAAGLHHVHIAAVFEISEANGLHYIAMQYIEGPTLYEFPRGDIRRIVSIVRDAARAVGLANDAGVIHRDLKPENLMVAANDHVFVMDFGLARQIENPSEHSLSGTIVGTPAYMSPEQAQGFRGDRRTDVYGLGATLYTALTGQRPHAKGELYEVLRRIQEEDVVTPRRYVPRIDADLETIILKCLEKNPAHRYQGAQDLAADLDRYLQGEPVEARPAGIVYRLFKKMAKRKAIVVAAVCLLVAGVFGLLVLREAGRARDTQEISDANRKLALGQLRQSTETALSAALALRRLGDLKGMEEFAKMTRDLCAETTARMPGLAEPHYRYGRILRAQMKFAEALAQQEKALAKEPGHAAARLEHVYLRTLLYQEKYTAMNTEWQLTHNQLVDARGQVARIESPSASEIEDEALRAERLAIQAEMPKIDHPLPRAYMSLLTREYEKTKGLLRTAIREAPDFEDLWIGLALILGVEGSHDEAVQVLTEAHERDKGYLPFLEERAERRIKTGSKILHNGRNPEADVSAGLADCDKVLAVTPGSSHIRMLRIQANNALGLWGLNQFGRDPESYYRAALQDVTVGLGHDPNQTIFLLYRAHLNNALARSQATRGKDPSDCYRESIEACTEMIRKYAKLEAAWIRRSQARGNLGTHLGFQDIDPAPLFPDALADVNEAIRLNSRNSEAWMARADIRLNVGVFKVERKEDPRPDYEAAIVDYSEAIALSPNFGPLFSNRAHARCAWIDYSFRRSLAPPATLTEWHNAVISDFEEAIRINPQDGEAWYRKGVSRSIAGQYELAISDLKKAIEINPKLEPQVTKILDQCRKALAR